MERAEGPADRSAGDVTWAGSDFPYQTAEVYKAAMPSLLVGVRKNLTGDLRRLYRRDVARPRGTQAARVVAATSGEIDRTLRTNRQSRGTRSMDTPVRP